MITVLLITQSFRSRNPSSLSIFSSLIFQNYTHKPGIFLHNHEHGVLLSVIQRVFGGIPLKFVHTTSLKALMETPN